MLTSFLICYSNALTKSIFVCCFIVWELQAADLSKSSVHRGGVGRVDTSGVRGVGLRFPRFIRERPDKKPEGCTSAEQIVDMYNSQGEGQEHGNGFAAGEEDDEEDGI